MFFAEPPPPITLSVPLNPRAKRKKNVWSLPLVLFNYCFVVQDVQEMSLLLSLKTLESVYMHCELGKSLSCHFTYRHAYCVTKVSWHRTQTLPFTLWPPLWIMCYSSQCPPFYLKRPVRGKDSKERLLLWRPFTVCKCSDGSYNVKLIRLLLLTAMRFSTLCCFESKWQDRCRVLSKETRFNRSECMNAENLCTTYYLVLLFSMWTPALRCGVYLFTCLCLTLCALHRCSLLCYFQFGWLWWNGYEWAAHFNLLIHIGCSYFPPVSLVVPLVLPPSCPPTHFFIFWYNLWLHILPQLFRVSQSFLNWF